MAFPLPYRPRSSRFRKARFPRVLASALGALPSAGIFTGLLFTVPCSRADIIYQATPQRTERIYHRDAIVVKEDSNSIFYKHFELKERRVVKVRLEKGSLAYRVEKQAPAVRERILANWKRFGHTAKVTDLQGETRQIYALYLDFYPPGGRGSLHTVVPPRTTLPIRFSHGGVDEIDFSDIKRIEFQSSRMRVFLKAGQVTEGEFWIPTDLPAEARFLGMSESYATESEEVYDFYLPLEKVKEIQLGRERRRRKK